MNNGRRVSLFTLGCRLNQAETALIADSFQARGYTIVPFGSPAEVSVINTCSVTARADAHCRNAIRRARKVSPDGIIAAVGCYAQSETEAVKAVLGVDYIIGTDRKLKIAEIIGNDARPAAQEIFIQHKHTNESLEFDAVGYYPESTRANIKIQDGCDYNCAFCVLPRVRGRSRSRRMNDIIDEAKKLAARGHQEIVLAGVSIGMYAGEDFTIVDVARNIARIDAVKRVRLSSIEPSTITDDLLHWMAESEKACRHLHIPVQSGDDGILQAMRREYTLDDFKRLIEKAMNLMPDIGLGTDIIVGFPGEGEGEFQNTVRLVEELPFSYLHVFSYSDRPKTAGKKLPDKNNPETIKNRSDFMHEIGEQKKRAFAEKHIGQRVEVLVECRDENGLWNGFTSQYLKVYFVSEVELQNKIAFIVPYAYEKDELIGRLDSIMCDDSMEKELFGTGNADSHNEDFFRITDLSNAIDSLEKTLYFLKCIEEDEFYIKWVTLALDHALYGFMICNLKGSDYYRVLEQKALKRDRHKLISFGKALEYVQGTKFMKQNVFSKVLIIKESDKQEIIKFHNIRNKMAHLIPGNYSYHKYIDIFSKCEIVIGTIEKLAFSTWNMRLHMDRKQNDRVKLAIEEILRALESFHQCKNSTENAEN